MKKSVENLATSKTSGGRRYPLRVRRKYELDRYGVETILGSQDTINRKVRGKGTKTSLKAVDFANVAVPGEKVKKQKIIKVLENATNNDYQRRGVISKGAIIETEQGKCRVISRPGQHGTVNAVLMK